MPVAAPEICSDQTVCSCSRLLSIIVPCGVAGNPSGTAAAAHGDANATVAVITKKDIKNAQKAAKAAQKMAEFNKKFGGQAETVV